MEIYNDKMVPIEYAKHFVDEIPNCELHIYVIEDSAAIFLSY
jgi:hypothetical protein